jgi:hypothetical protein
VPKPGILPRRHLHGRRQFRHEAGCELRPGDIDTDRLEQRVQGYDRAIEDFVDVELDSGGETIADRRTRRDFRRNTDRLRVAHGTPP